MFEWLAGSESGSLHTIPPIFRGVYGVIRHNSGPGPDARVAGGVAGTGLLWEHLGLPAQEKAMLVDHCLMALSVGLWKGHARQLVKVGPLSVCCTIW